MNISQNVISTQLDVATTMDSKANTCIISLMGDCSGSLESRKFVS